MFVDFHCHLDLYKEIESLISFSNENKIYILSMTNTPRIWERVNQRLSKGKYIRVALGLHPELATSSYGEIPLFELYAKRTKYIGEIGLDISPHTKRSFKTQKQVFEKILALSSQLGGKYLSIHSRGAIENTYELIEKYPNAGVPVLHWFSGNKSDLKYANKLNCWFSVGYPMLQTKRGKQLISLLPRDRILTETDGPFVKIENRQIKPQDVELIEMGIAKIWGLPLEAVNDQIKQNFKQLLKIL